MQDRIAIGIFGGTFDPIHFGHLRIALELQQKLGLHKVRFIPNYCSPQRQSPLASPQDRAKMIQLAIASVPSFELDTQEIEQAKPCYTIDTLIRIKGSLGTRSTTLYLCLGLDAWYQLPDWHRWQELLQYCHIIVAHRPLPSSVRAEANLNKTLLADLYDKVGVVDRDSLQSTTNGLILFQQVTELAISATQLRAAVVAGESLQFLVPDFVCQYIDAKQLYCGQTSS